MTEDNRPLSQIYLEAAEDWCDKEAAAQLLEDCKSAVMSQRQTALGDLPVNRAEQIVKASPGWHEHLEKIVEARRIANLAKVQCEYIKMRQMEWISHQANDRVGSRL
jgi:hypothetical protein